MSCPNFCTMNDFSLFAFSTEDEFDMECTISDVEEALEALQREMIFFKVSLINGYYYGVQLYAEAEYDLQEDNYSNEDCRYYFDLCRSVAYRKFESEKRKIEREFRKIAKKFGFEELVCTARFSNGEAFFSPVTPRTRMLSAVNM